MDLMSMIKQCGLNIPPGTVIDLFYLCTCEMDTFPQTEKALGTSSDLGADVRLGEPFDFSNAESGKGFWRQVKILTDTGGIKMTAEGEVGGQGLASGVRFFVLGSEAEQIGFAKQMVAASGCLSMMLKQRESPHQRVIGKPDQPAYVQTLEMDGGEKNGDRNGTAYVCQYSGPLYLYDDATHGIDITPNP